MVWRRASGALLGTTLLLSGCEPELLKPRDVLRDLPGIPLTEAQIKAIPLNSPVVWLTPEGGTFVVVEDSQRWLDWTDDLGFWERRTAREEARERLASLITPKTFPLPVEVGLSEDDALYNAMLRYTDALRQENNCRQWLDAEPKYLDGNKVRPAQYGPCEWPSATTVLVDRSVPYDALRGTVYRLGQAQMGSFDIVPYGEQALRAKPGVSRDLSSADFRSADTFERPTPLASRQTSMGSVINDRHATIQVRLKNEPKSVFSEQNALPAIGGAKVESFESSKPPPKPPETVGDAYPDTNDPFLYASFAAAAESATYPVLPSVEMLVHRSKVTDDALMASLERKLDPLSIDFVRDLSQTLVDTTEARAWVSAAAALGEVDVGDVPPSVASLRDEHIADFREDPGRSSVLGIYSESDDLTRGYLRDRMHKSDLGDDRVVVSNFKRHSPEIPRWAKRNKLCWISDLCCTTGWSNLH